VVDEPERPLGQLLLSGEIDAIIAAHPPSLYTAGNGRIRRLFTDLVSVEQAYYKATGILPIMHLVAIRKDLVDRHPWVSANLQAAFAEARRLSLRRLEDESVSRFAVPWLPAALAQLKAVSPAGWFEYGIERNRRVLDTFCRYAFEQGLTPVQLTPEDLFDPNAGFEAKI
jgi:4,5-dihydroxyphthalate decarboxylase